MVVIADPDSETGKTGDTTSEDSSSLLIPLKMDSHETWTQGVKIRYHAFPFDLRFAITFHKVQGQTEKKVILFLHKRTTKQLAPLQWESLYVAYTRVKCADDIRVCYFGSDNPSPDLSGLQHLKKLRRPELYDVWQSAYDKNGKWNDDNLRRQAEQARYSLCRKLRRVTSIQQVGLPKLKEWSEILDVLVPFKPGTKRKNKPQYVQAITPIWAGLNGGSVTLDDLTSDVRVCVINTQSKLKRTSRRSNGLRRRLKTSVTRHSDDTSRTSTRLLVKPPSMGSSQISQSRQVVTKLRIIRNRCNTRLVAKTQMQRICYCVDLQYVGECSQWSVFTLGTPGEFICDTIIHYFCSHFSNEMNNRSFSVDPLLQLGTRRLLRRGIADKHLERLHRLRQTLLFPLNVPLDTHWIIVLVWLNENDELCIQCRNSMETLRHNDDETCVRVKTYIQSLYDHDESCYTCPVIEIIQSSEWTEQTPGVYGCGLHVISHAYLVSKGLEHTHTFDNRFVESIRSYCLYLLHQKRCRRSTTYIRPIDLTSDHPRIIELTEL